MIQIRKAKKSDLKSIKLVEDDCFLLPWHIQSLQTFINNSLTHICFVAADRDADDQIVGYIAGISTGDEAEIANVAVLKKYQNQGIGVKIITYFLDYLREKGVRMVFLEVRESNRQAIHVYQKQGFSLCGTRKKYYQEPVEDALVFSLILNDDSNEMNKES